MEMRQSRELSSPEKLAQKVLDIYTIKEEELTYVFNKDELINICKHKNCRVRMDRWNPIYEFYWQLKRRGRLENKPPQKVQKLLVKLGNRYKNDPKRSYAKYTIEKDRYNAWQLRKCWNVRWLEDIRENSDGSASETNSSNDSDVAIITQNSNGNQSPIEASNGPPTYMNNLNYNPSEIMGRGAAILDSENFSSTKEKDTDTSNTEHSNSLGILKVAVDDIVGTESFPNIFSQSEPPALIFEGNSENYENFQVSIPMTSTQSQERQ